MFGEKLENIRKTSPLIHNITNYVTANDCANILLACGAFPTMADDASEVEEITAISNALNINIGTLNAMVEGMFLAGKKANALGRPVVLDPEKARAYRAQSTPEREDTCTMCGKMCAVRNINKILRGEDVDIMD